MYYVDCDAAWSSVPSVSIGPFLTLEEANEYAYSLWHDAVAQRERAGGSESASLLYIDGRMNGNVDGYSVTVVDTEQGATIVPTPRGYARGTDGVRQYVSDAPFAATLW